MKLNITPGLWAKNAQQSFIYGNTEKSETIVEDLICEPPFDEEGYPRWKDNSTAIVIAVNNTYHKGINPEAVPEMLELLKDSLSEISWLLRKEKEREGNGSYRADSVIIKINNIIQKATL